MCAITASPFPVNEFESRRGVGSNPVIRLTIYPLTLFWGVLISRNSKFLLTLSYKKWPPDDDPSLSLKVWMNL